MEQFKYIQPLDQMARISRTELGEKLDEILDKADKDNVGFVITDEGKDDSGMSQCIVNRLPMILCMSVAVITETIDLWLDASDVLVTVFYQKDVHEHGVELHLVDAVPDVYKIP